jgi:hypothetical protein
MLAYGIVSTIATLAINRQAAGITLHLPKIILLHVSLFMFLSFSAYDFETKHYFVPGYTNNHDSINILSSVMVLKENISEKNVTANIGRVILDSYPIGGTHLVALISPLTGLSPYAAYHRLIVYFYLLLLFPVYAILFQENSSSDLKWSVIIVSAFNYLSIAILNTAVLGSTLASVLVLTWIVAVVAYSKNRLQPKHFFIISLLLIIANMYLYVYLSLPLLLGAAGSIILIERTLIRRFLPIASILLAAVISISLFPSIQRVTFAMIHANLYSDNKEASLMGGAIGNTAGFINPLEGLSIWFWHLDYRYADINTITIMLFTGLLILQVISLIKNPISKSRQKTILVLYSSYLPLVLFTYFISKSPYQNVKAYQFATGAVPILAFLINDTNNNKRLPKITLGLYIVIALFSTLFSYIHIQRPPQDTYSGQQITRVCKQIHTPENPIDWYDYSNIHCSLN